MAAPHRDDAAPSPQPSEVDRTGAPRPASTRARLELGVVLLGITVVAVVLGAAGAPAGARGPAVLLAASLLPGYALVVKLPVSLPTLLALDVCVSLALEAAGAFLLVQTRFWHPLALGIAVAALGSGATLAAVVQLRHSLTHGRRATRPGQPVPEAAGRPPRTRAVRRERRLRTLSWIPPVVGAGLWAAALVTTDARSLRAWGLIPALTWPYWAGLGLVLLGAVGLSQASRLRHGPLAAHVGVLLAMLYATAPALADAPRYTYTYKHIAITQYIELYGSVDKQIDIYHRWPGFFSLSAWFSQIAGLPDPTSYAAWAEIYFTGLDALVVFAAVHVLSRSARTAWQATLLFTVTNWIGQDYYSPQAFGFLLMLGVLLICLVGLRADPGPFGRWVERLVSRVFRVRAPLRKGGTSMLGRGAVGRLVGLAVLVDAVLAASHQLTPYVLLVQLGALVLGGYVRPWWMLGAASIATVGYLVPNYDFVVNTFGILTSADPLANATSKTVDGNPVLALRIIGDLALLSLAGCFLMCFLGLVRRVRRGLVSDAVVVGTLAFAPLLTLAAQNYGGEARLRVLLYALPWLCTGITWLWSPEGAARRGVRLLVPTGITVGLTVCFVAFFFGREDLNQLNRQEVRAAAYLFDPATVQPGAVVMLTAPNFPARYGPLYFRLARADLPALSFDGFGSRPLLFPSNKDVEAAATYIQQAGGNGGYLVFSQGQEAFARDYQLYPAYALRAFEGAVAQSRRFTLVYNEPSARIYELVQ